MIDYINDMVVTEDDPEERVELQAYLSKEFGMKDRGPFMYFLGMKVYRLSKGIVLDSYLSASM